MTRHIATGLVLIAMLPAAVHAQTPLDAAFTYQGQLKQNGQPANGNFDLEFRLFDGPTGGTQTGDPVLLAGVPVASGLFTVILNSGGEFGPSAFNGDARWLEIRVSGTLLSPRQELTGAPYAVFATKPWESAGGNVFYTVGNVGIGTASPATALQVAGTVTADAFVGDGSGLTGLAVGQWQTSGNDIFYTAGSVGIGTTDPHAPCGGTLVVKPRKLPTARSRVACAYSAATGTIYCFGGWDASSSLWDIIEYDPSADTLEIQPVQLPTARYAMGHAAAPVTGNIFLVGGWNESGSVGDILEYNPLTGELSNPVDLGAPRGGIACAASTVTGKIYCFGGSDPPTSNYWSIILEYDPITHALVDTQADLPSSRSNLACAEDPTTGKIYCFGGDEAGGRLDEILEYDPRFPSQSPVIKSATLPAPRSRIICATALGTGRIYCFGGDNGDEVGVDQILEYDPGTDTLRVVNAVLPAPTTRLGCAHVPGTGLIYCFGGDSSTTPVDTILEYTTLARTLLQVGEPGDGTGAIANAWSVFSSREFKRDISPLSSIDCHEILSKLSATDAVRFSYARDPRRTPHLGVVAEHCPAEILAPGGKAVSLADYTTFLMAAIKAQQALIEEKNCELGDLQAKFAELQGQLAGTQARLARLEALLDRWTRVGGRER